MIMVQSGGQYPGDKPQADGLGESPNITGQKQLQCLFCSSRLLSFCGSMDTVELERLDKARSSFTLEARQSLFDEGQDATHIYNLTSGSVKLYKLLPDGRRQITGFLFMGDFFGFVGNEKEEYIYSAEALTKTTMCKFPRLEFYKLMTDYPQIERSILKIASNELAEAQQQMLLLGRMTAVERVASFISMLSERAVKRGQKANPISVPMGQIDIGDYLGLTTETVSRSLSRLKKLNILETELDHKYRILDSEALKRLTDGD